MAEEKAPERSAGPSGAELISVTVSVLPPAARPPLRERLAAAGVSRWARALLAAGAALAVLGAIVAVVLLGNEARRPASANRDARRGSIEASEYPYPLRCMRLTISDIKPVYVAEVERANGCVGYSRYVTASFRQIDGGWKLALGDGRLLVSAVAGAHRPSLGCVSLAVVLHDPAFVGTDRAICDRGQLEWLR